MPKNPDKNRKIRPNKPKKPTPPPTFFSFSLSTRLTIEIGGYNFERLLAALDESGVSVRRVCKTGAGKSRLEIAKKDGEKTFAICDRMCYNYSVIGATGAIAYLVSHANRVGIAIGTVLCALLTLLVGSFLTDVKISDLDYLSERDIIRYLAESDVRVGSRIATLDREQIRRRINAFEGVAESSVEIRGSTLHLTIIERDPTEKKVEDKAEIKSLYDARVTRIICEGGTSRVKRGAIVGRGDLLIEGVLEDGEGERISVVPARGEVYGEVNFTASRIVSTESLEYRPTGREKKSTAFRLFGSDVGAVRSPYEFFESHTERTTLFGITLTRTVYRETAPVTVEYPIEELASRFERETSETYVGNAAEVEVTSSIKPLDATTYKITVYLQAEIKISD